MAVFVLGGAKGSGNQGNSGGPREERALTYRKRAIPRNQEENGRGESGSVYSRLFSLVPLLR
jgi:hypothetical protein